MPKFTTEEFIERARKMHGDRYNYSKTEYIGIYEPVIIICAIHGDFKQVAKDHLRGNGCSKCNGRFMNTEFLIEKAREIHGDKYDYSKVKYINSDTKIVVICPKHGDFLTRAADFIRGHACAGCKADKAKERHLEKRKTQYLPYSEASLYCIENNIKSGKQYYKFYKLNKPNFLPAEPSRMYEEWINWQTFLNTNNVSARDMHINWVSFDEAKAFVQKLGLKSRAEYEEWWEKNKPDFLPKTPEMYYKRHK